MSKKVKICPPHCWAIVNSYATSTGEHGEVQKCSHCDIHQTRHWTEVTITTVTHDSGWLIK